MKSSPAPHHTNTLASVVRFLIAAQSPIELFVVTIAKDYFPKEIWPKELVQEYMEVWKIKAHTRSEAARLIWSQHGDRLLAMMGPRRTTVPRKISLHVALAKDYSGPGRYSPVLVYVGE